MTNRFYCCHTAIGCQLTLYAGGNAISHTSLFFVVRLPVGFSLEVASFDIVTSNSTRKPPAHSHTHSPLFNYGKYVVPSNRASFLPTALCVFSATYLPLARLHRSPPLCLHIHRYIYIYIHFQNVISVSFFHIQSRNNSRTVPGSIPGGVTGDFFRGSFRQNHVPWGRLSLWKWVPGISPGVKAPGAYGWRPTTLVVPNVEMIRGLNLPGTPRATSACRGTPLL